MSTRARYQPWFRESRDVSIEKLLGRFSADQWQIEVAKRFVKRLIEVQMFAVSPMEWVKGT